jgi:DNA-binding response OmpR family regulator
VRPRSLLLVHRRDLASAAALAAPDLGLAVRPMDASGPSPGDAVLVVHGPDASAARAVAALRSRRPEAAVLVLVLPEADGPEVRASLLDAGADDCVGAGIGAAELRARVEAVARRRAPRPADAPLRVGDLEVRPSEGRVVYDGRRVPLPTLPMLFLAHLVEAGGAVASRAEIAAALGAARGARVAGAKSVDLLAARVRAALGDGVVETVRGVGYRIGRCVPRDEPEPAPSGRPHAPAGIPAARTSPTLH